MGRPLIDRTGEKYNSLTIIKMSDKKTKNGSYYWWCQCDCGSQLKEIDYSNLKNGNVKTCGQCKKYNTYDLSGEYGIGYTSNGKEFYFDLEDYELISKYNWSITGSGYLINTVNDSCISMHRLIMNPNKDMMVDHINHNTLDNRKSNLRICNASQNNINKRIKGYTLRENGKYEVNVRINGIPTYIGIFDTKEEALSARLKAYDIDHINFSYKENN